jgi:hypothetical protein|uniref:PEGA domain-containing protein n=1 Tax=candidate division WOR-3 bacterium TaxID=2052148 RepID=A0A7V3PU96_UNCW3
MGVLISIGIIFLSGVVTPGFLTVNSQPAGLPVYVEGEKVGLAPVEKYQLEPGRYWVTVVPNDSLERLYETVRAGRLGQRLTALWTLARIDAASAQVEVFPGMETRVEISSRLMEKSACRAKWLFGGSVFGLFSLGTVVGLVIGMAVN